MYVLKRILPFLLTLIVGAALVNWMLPDVYQHSTLLVVKPPQSQVKNSNPGDIFRSREVTKRAVLLSRPEAGYTAEARQNESQGTVRIRAVLSSSGEVTSTSSICIEKLNGRADRAARDCARRTIVV